jgi:tetratricopeptide (TPR) repeat protein
MPGHVEDRARQVVPRWRTFASSVERGELLSLKERSEAFATDEMLERNVRDWNENHSVSVAADLVSIAFTLGRFEVAQDAARFLVAQAVSEPLAGLTALYLAGGQRQVDQAPEAETSSVALRRDISAHRLRLQEYPRNPILWTHLARAYASLGLSRRADRAIRTALSLAPHNRFVVRSASRYFLHAGDPEKAHDVVRLSAAVRRDPWLLAAEVALADSNGKSSKLIRDARQLVESKNYSQNHLSELASALATIEASSGNRRAAQKLIRLSLESATENATAQAAWLQRNFSTLGGAEISIGLSWEARAWTAELEGNWSVVVRESERWQSDEPFSSRPVLVGSHAAIMSEEFDRAIAILRFGLLSNPDDFGLRNNLAYSYAEKGMIAEAIEVLRPLRKDRLSPAQGLVLDATTGLMAFRSGDIFTGRTLYERAIATAERIRDPNETLARVHYILELVRVGDPIGLQMKEQIISKDLPNSRPSVLTLISRLRRTKSPIERSR